ncbi:flavodoxin [Bacillus methanolicus]|uniref:flavodoxin domain-containing protein n=1 Tax=Bacillus methanolicus TaxID=1471 RepID=UPI00237FF7C5|nr:flavodoxin domain-containing protein [Bacillus methanolicus]MDE3839090.1 flavodoxin [Bacillus methanolicus]
MNIAIVYTSITGNTKELVSILHQFFLKYPLNIALYSIDQFPIGQLNQFHAIIVATYTWGNGDIPQEMKELYRAFENQDVKNVITGVVGTGDRFYPKFCGAVDVFRDMLYVHTNLAATLKVELMPQSQDIERCIKFVDCIVKRLI